MKGIVFKELISMMEDQFGDEMVDDILTSLPLKSKGAYTAIGYYDYNEALSIVTKLSEKTGLPVPALVKAFGRHLLDTFYKLHPGYFKHPDVCSFLKTVDDHIHVEVRKLNPDAELPKLDYFVEDDSKTVRIEYTSAKPFADLAEGLIERSVEIFENNETLEVKDRDSQNQRTFFLRT